jgi:hypothetical protein
MPIDFQVSRHARKYTGNLAIPQRASSASNGREKNYLQRLQNAKS